MENNLGEVEKAAREKNGWRVIAASRTAAATGLRPNGHIAFMRETAPWDDKRGGTAAWALMENGQVLFHNGHYDLSRQDAMLDFIERAESHARAYGG